MNTDYETYAGNAERISVKTRMTTDQILNSIIQDRVEECVEPGPAWCNIDGTLEKNIVFATRVRRAFHRDSAFRARLDRYLFEAREHDYDGQVMSIAEYYDAVCNFEDATIEDCRKDLF